MHKRPCCSPWTHKTLGSRFTPVRCARARARSGRFGASWLAFCVVAACACVVGLLSAMTASFPCAATFWYVYEGTKGVLANQVRVPATPPGGGVCGGSVSARHARSGLMDVRADASSRTRGGLKPACSGGGGNSIVTAQSVLVGQLDGC
jgi:hypothetical protein